MPAVPADQAGPGGGPGCLLQGPCSTEAPCLLLLLLHASASRGCGSAAPVLPGPALPAALLLLLLMEVPGDTSSKSESGSGKERGPSAGMLPRRGSAGCPGNSAPDVWALRAALPAAGEGSGVW
jgi:hypothetical protein